MISSRPMKVLFIASEAAPYAKTGGLGDVSGALPQYLQQEGLEVKTVIPLYRSINRQKYQINKIFDNSCVKMGNCEEFYSVFHTDKPSGNDVYFIDFDKYFNRHGIYNDVFVGDYTDSVYRYAFLVRAAMQMSKDLGFRPDIIHTGDWQTALACYYLKTENDAFFENTKSVFTIHNIGYQGIYGADAMEYAKIRPMDFKEWGLESYGKLNLMKAGILFADKITTVSPTYAQEILGPIGSNGMARYLQARRQDLVGILNGCDTQVWNTETDTFIPCNYNIDTFKQGKKCNKQALQQTFWLNDEPNVPIFGFIARLTKQKGIDLLAQVVEKFINNMNCQFVLLGSGEEQWAEWYFGGLPAKYPGRIGAYIGYSEKKAHLIEAGCDFFLMPSVYEPCGLNQMYSQLYGTLPVVRATGGLEDTVSNYDGYTGTGTGFKFWDISADALYNTIGWANATYWDKPADIDNMIRESMRKDYSWKKSARKYIDLYNSMF